MKVNGEALRKWIDALRSGDYKQGFGWLMTKDPVKGDKFCCLGVACVAFGIQRDEYSTGEVKFGQNNFLSSLPDEMIKIFFDPSCFPPNYRYMPFQWNEHSRGIAMERGFDDVLGLELELGRTYTLVLLNDVYAVSFSTIANILECDLDFTLG
jgi:hypothetical protein